MENEIKLCSLSNIIVFFYKDKNIAKLKKQKTFKTNPLVWRTAVLSMT